MILSTRYVCAYMMIRPYLFAVIILWSNLFAFVNDLNDVLFLLLQHLKARDGSKDVDFVQLCKDWLEQVAPILGKFSWSEIFPYHSNVC